jgi:hypothetical protein
VDYGFNFPLIPLQVFEPVAIRRQFIFQTWIMLKMFMGACFGSCIAFLIYYNTKPELFERARDKVVVQKSWVVVLIGKALVGCVGCG